MSSVLYLLREPVEQISHCLYRDADDDAMVIRIDQRLASHGQFAEIMKPGQERSFHTGQFLSSRELLQLVMNTQKIVTL